LDRGSESWRKLYQGNFQVPWIQLRIYQKISNNLRYPN
jgi:hypothetical protein